jgi:hypothetical protein
MHDNIDKAESLWIQTMKHAYPLKLTRSQDITPGRKPKGKQQDLQDIIFWFKYKFLFKMCYIRP